MQHSIYGKSTDTANIRAGTVRAGTVHWCTLGFK